MKRGNAIYLSAFLCGVIITNVLESKGWTDAAYFYRYNLMQLTFDEIKNNSYLIQLLFFRFRTIGMLWLLGKVLPVKLLRILLGSIVCIFFGMIFTLAILANGMWGIMLMLALLFPQWIFYMGAFGIWGSFEIRYAGEVQRKKELENGILIVILMIIGCVCEAYICPSLLNFVINN